MTEQERLLQNQLITQVRVFIQQERENLATLTRFERDHQQEINQNMQRCLQMDAVSRRLVQIEA